MKSTKQDRCKIVNEIIREIASRGRKFFSYETRVAEVFIKHGRIYMRNEYNGADMNLHTKHNYQPNKWTHGGTLWGLTRDFRDYIKTGEYTNHKHGYGGLYCEAWGYPHEDMIAIRTKAVELGYLKTVETPPRKSP